MLLSSSPLYFEAELITRVFYLVLSLSVSHSLGWDSLNSQDDISRAQVDLRGLTARSHLKTVFNGELKSCKASPPGYNLGKSHDSVNEVLIRKNP